MKQRDAKHSYEQQRWESDVNSYYRHKRWAQETTFQAIRDLCERRMSEIKSRWPSSHQAFE